MKNIHIIATDKPSRLWFYKQTDILLTGLTVEKARDIDTQNIYITSDEEIKEGDWVIEFQKGDNIGEVHFINGEYVIANDIQKKIIITTDQDLDGVQVIDDEFLKWFVKNSSCEEVEVIDKMRIFNVDELRERHRKGLPHLYSEKIAYKIVIPKEEICSFCNGIGQVVSSTTISRFKTCDCKIIPKEELKQNKTCILCDGTGETTFSGTYNSQRKCDVCNGKGYIGLDIIKQAEDDLQLIKSLQETKQETIQEVAERILGDNIDGLKDALQDDDLFYFYKGVIQSYGEAMAQYQAKRMYGEEEMLQALNIGFTSTDETWEECVEFTKEQFKKK